MDLNAELDRLRQLAKRIADNLGPDAIERGDALSIDPDDVYEFAQKFQALDKVITESGIRPSDWEDY